jgi:hypothetical protein
MALNNCFNSPTWTSMTEHLGGIASPSEALSLVPERFVIGPECAIVRGSCTSSAGRALGIPLLTSKLNLMRRRSRELFSDDGSDAGSQELDRP